MSSTDVKKVALTHVKTITFMKVYEELIRKTLLRRSRVKNLSIQSHILKFDNMNQIILCYIVQQLLFLTSIVESLRGERVLDVVDHEFPFIASIRNFLGHHFCSGTLITNQHILTAAHCLEDEHPSGVWVVFGAVYSRTATVRHAVASWITYNEWTTRQSLGTQRSFHDTAIVVLMESVTHLNVAPVHLTILNKQQVQGKTATIIGWRGNPLNKVLKKAVVNIWSDKDCERNAELITERKLKFDEKLMCTAAEPYILLEDGDSGGPLLDRFGALLGVHYGDGPEARAAWDHFQDEFLYQYQVNLHSSISYNRRFIADVAGNH